MADTVKRVDVVQKEGASLPPRVSFSQMSLYQQCPLKFFFTYIDNWKEPPTAALVGGNITHVVTEHLYRLAPEQRTLETALELLREHGPKYLENPLHADFRNDVAMKFKVREAIENLFAIEDPTQLAVQPEHLEMNLRTSIEGVEFTGTVDRFTQTDVNRVSDYKTGKGPGKALDSKMTQPYLYALAFRLQHDIAVDEVELIFLNAKEVHRKPVEDAYLESAAGQLVQMREESQRDFSESAWDAKINRFCDWCAFKSVCPAYGQNANGVTPGSVECDQVLQTTQLTRR